MADAELSQPSLCQRICCCFSSTSKEPPVQLIRSEALQVNPPEMKTNGRHISAAESSVDGFEDVNLDVRTTADDSNPRLLVQKEPNGVNLNDIMMEEVLRDEKGDDGECVIEDAVSISTDVVQEVDETELSRLRLHSLMDTPPSERRKKEVEQQAEPTKEDSQSEEEDNVVSRFSEYLPSTSKDGQEKRKRLPSSSDEEEEHKKAPAVETSSVDIVVVESKAAEIESGRKSPSIIEEESLSESEHAADEKKKDADAESVSEEVIMIEEVETLAVQKAFDPPSIPPKSIMYADTSSEEESDEELEPEILPPVQRSQKVTDFEKIRIEPTQNGRLESESTTVASNTFEDSGSDDVRIVTDGPRIKDYKEEKLTVTRIVVRDDGKPDELTSGAVKMTLDGREAITDEEFSEKLI